MSAAIAAAAAGARCYPRSSKRSSSNSVTENSYGGGTPNQQSYLYATTTTTTQPSNNRYESLKQRDWNTFGQYRKTYNPPLTLSKCGSEHVLEFLRNLGENTNQAWGSLDGLIGRLRVAFEENGGRPETNPFGARDVRLYLSQLRDSQAKARGIAYDQK